MKKQLARFVARGQARLDKHFPDWAATPWKLYTQLCVALILGLIALAAWLASVGSTYSDTVHMLRADSVKTHKSLDSLKNKIRGIIPPHELFRRDTNEQPHPR